MAILKTPNTMIVPIAVNSGKSFAEQIKKEHCIYTIYTQHDLKGETVTLPRGSVLVFHGNGALLNGTIIGKDGIIQAEEKVFYDVQVKGTWKCAGNVGWFAESCYTIERKGVCYISHRVDDTAGLQAALDSAFRELIVPPRLFYIGRTLVLRKEKKIVMQGSGMRLALEQCQTNMMNTAILFTDLDIDLLSIAVNEGMSFNQNMVEIQGGNFDVSLCQDYHHNCIEVRSDNNEKVWGLTINTNVKGKYGNTHGVGINLSPVQNMQSTGYITQVRINSTVSNFGVGVKAVNYMDIPTAHYYNWCTDVTIDGAVINCPVAIDCDTDDCDIRAMVQAGYFFDSKDNDSALIRLNTARGAISSNVFDIRLQGSDGKWSNNYALNIVREACGVVPYGAFLAQLAIYLGNDIVTGYKERLRTTILEK